MQININPNVEFTFSDGRAVTVDAEDLDLFVRKLWDEKSTTRQDLDEHGRPQIDPETGTTLLIYQKNASGETLRDAEDKPVPLKFLAFAVIESDFAEWFKERAKGVLIKHSELMGLWHVANADPSPWAKKNAQWQSQEAPQPGSPTSPLSTDPRFANED